MGCIRGQLHAYSDQGDYAPFLSLKRHPAKAPRLLQQLLQGAMGDAGSGIPQS